MFVLGENHFRKCFSGNDAVWLVRKLKSVDPKKMPLTTEIDLHFYFPFKAFPKNERERERERARARGEATNAISPSQDRAIGHDLAVARSRRWSRSRLREITPARDPRGRSVEEDREIREEDPSIAISPSRDQIGRASCRERVCLAV